MVGSTLRASAADVSVSEADQTMLGVHDENPRTSGVSTAADGVTGFNGVETAAGDDTGPLTVGDRFGSRYRITRLLGIGGMGAVYEAWDAELGVSVALKVIRVEAGGDPSAVRELERRFKRELLLARQVTHKNVVRIHDLGEIDGIKYITMPYVEGQDLGSILKTEGRLPIGRALAITRQALSGLVAAHAAGIVHRDLKPANIMVDTDGQALLMDFGIARSVGIASEQITPGRHRTAPGAFGETMVGAIVGTIHYMAPEQARGDTVDHRADIYAFGLILRDMLIGLDRQKSAATAFAELQRRIDEPPPSLKSLDPTIPEPLDRLISRCLEPDPAKRYQTTAELEADLNRLDDKGELIPIKRVVGLPLVAAVVSLLLVVAGGAWWYARSRIPPAAHDPVTVVIADLQNNTNDPAFDRTLEPMLKRALEGASFISVYDRSGISRTLGTKAPEKFDETTAREFAVKQGLGVVLSGAINRQGNGYGVTVKAVRSVTGDAVTSAQATASDKSQVLGVATTLVTRVRKALGDDASEAAQMFAMTSVSAMSLDVVGLYAAGMDSAANGKFEEARDSFSKAVSLDPKFGVGYQGLAVALRNLGQLQESEKYTNEALSHLDGMTERERYSTRGFAYRVAGDWPQCVQEYGALVERYAADAIGHNQRALCLSKLRRMGEAVTEMRQLVKILPNRVFFRNNLALLASYAGEFQSAEGEAQAIAEPDETTTFALAFAQLGQGKLREARASYDKVAMLGPEGMSIAASGLGDLALHEGRYADAVRVFGAGAASDLASNSPDRAAMKFVSLAYAHLWRGQKGPAAAAAEKALANSKGVPIRFLAARVFVETGALDRARKLATGLADELPAEPQAYAKVIEAEIALRDKEPRHAIKVLSDANANLLDTWLAHFDLGRAYLALDNPAYVQADAEFDRCIKRRGEVLSLFVDEEPTYGFFPPVYYYQGLVRKGLKNAGFAESYRAYLNIRGESKEDQLAADIRRSVNQ